MEEARRGVQQPQPNFGRCDNNEEIMRGDGSTRCEAIRMGSGGLRGKLC